MTKLANLKQAIRKEATPERAKASAWYFKTGKGEYGEGDVFIGLKVPQQRQIAKKFKDLSLNNITKLLQSKIHEERFIALEILVMQFEKADPKAQEQIVNCYLKNTAHIDNWDLVDTSAPYILGQYLLKTSQIQKPLGTTNCHHRYPNLYSQQRICGHSRHL